LFTMSKSPIRTEGEVGFVGGGGHKDGDSENLWVGDAGYQKLKELGAKPVPA